MPRTLSLSPENGFLNFFKLKLGFLDFWLGEGKDETAPEEFVKEWVMKSPKILLTAFADISPIDLLLCRYFPQKSGFLYENLTHNKKQWWIVVKRDI